MDAAVTWKNLAKKKRDANSVDNISYLKLCPSAVFLPPWSSQFKAVLGLGCFEASNPPLVTQTLHPSHLTIADTSPSHALYIPHWIP